MKEDWSVSSGNGGLDTGVVKDAIPYRLFILRKNWKWKNLFRPRERAQLWSNAPEGTSPAIPNGWKILREYRYQNLVREMTWKIEPGTKITIETIGWKLPDKKFVRKPKRENWSRSMKKE